MDVFSHAAWGYAILRFRGRSLARWGALAGAAPDLLYFIPFKVEQVLENGSGGLAMGRDPAIWRADGPPLPPELVEAYHRYYVYSHSLIVLGLAVLTLYLLKKRRWIWLGVPYAAHILLDLPTHERYLTPLFYPLSNWTIQGISWADPVIFFPNLVALVLTYAFLWRKFRIDCKGKSCLPEQAATGK